MKNYRFYAEYAYKKDKRKATRKDLKNHVGTVLALLLDDNGRPLYSPCTAKNSWQMDCISAVYYVKDSPVAFSTCDRKYLQNWCKWISEKQAREIHPKLFQYLEQ